MATITTPPAPRGGLPTPRTDDAQLQRWTELISQEVRRLSGNMLTTQQLSDLGILSINGRSLTATPVGPVTAIAGTGIPEPPALGIPPIPTGFTANAGIDLVILFWDNPHRIYSNHSLTQVFRGTDDVFANAAMIGMSAHVSYVDTTAGSGQTYFYWIRWVSTDSIEGQPTVEKEVEVATDPATAITELSEDILSDPFVASLVSTDPLITADRIAHWRSLFTLVLAADYFTSFDQRAISTEAEVTSLEGDISRLESLITGRSLGPAPNTFSAATLADAVGLRDTQSMDAAWLAMYNADSTLVIRLVYGVLQQFQNRDGGNWVNNGEPEVTAQAVSQLNASVLAQGGRLDIAETDINSLETANAARAGEIQSNATSITALQTAIGGKADASALNALTNTVTSNGSNISANSQAITGLNTALDEKADASALSSLEATVTQQGTDITSNTTAITGLRTDVDGKASAMALGSLSTTVTQQGETITAQGQSITSINTALDGKADTADLDAKADASALMTLEGTVTTQGRTVASNTQAITALESTLVGRALGPTQNMFTGADRDAAESARDAYEAANSSWLAMYDSDDTLNIVLTYGVLQQYQRRVSGAWTDNGDPVASAAAITQLNTSVQDHEGRITTNADSITALTTSVDGKADTSVVDALESTVTSQGNSITANTNSITALQASTGGGRMLGAEENEFSAATEMAAENARDIYAAANPAWLAAYNADATNYIVIEFD